MDLVQSVFFAVLLVSSSPQESGPSGGSSQEFLQQILRFYGQQTNISLPDFEDLVGLMSARPPEELTEGNPLVNETVSTNLTNPNLT